MQTVHFIAAVSLAIMTMLGTVVGTVWRVSKYLQHHETMMIKLMNDHQILDNREFAAIRMELDQSGDTIRHDFGEVGTAIRQKLHEMELEASETQKANLEVFARRESVYSITSEISRDVKILMGKLHDVDVKVSIIHRNGNHK